MQPSLLRGHESTKRDIRALLVAAGQRYNIPPMILFAMAFAESGWQQFNADGTPHMNKNDGGVGIMQLTGATAAGTGYNASELANYIYDNIDAGAKVLAGKWGNTPVIGDGNGNVGREKLENWYYAIWAYNSWGSINNPNWQNVPPPNTAHNPTYQDIVYGYIANPPSPLTGMWVGCTLSKPTNAEIGSVTVGILQGCGQTIANTPSSPYGIHIDANFDGVIDGDPGGGTDIYVDGNYSGTLYGSAANPYSTIAAAVNAASTTQTVTIHITPFWYKENISTSRHIHFVTNGSGTVRIGG